MILFSKGLKDTEISSYKNTLQISIYFFQISVNEMGKMLKLELTKFLGELPSYLFLNRNQSHKATGKRTHPYRIRGSNLVSSETENI